MPAVAGWPDLLVGSATTALGWALSSVSRGYREHRAQIYAKEQADHAIEEKRWTELLESVSQVREEQRSLATRMAVVEAVARVVGPAIESSHGGN